MTNIESICYSVNRRILRMNYATESRLREYLANQVIDDDIVLVDADINNIADILDVNTNCIFDLLSDLELI